MRHLQRWLINAVPNLSQHFRAIIVHCINALDDKPAAEDLWSLKREGECLLF